MGGHLGNFEDGLSQTLKMCKMRGGLIYNVPKIRVKCFISLTKVYVNFDHDILHKF